MFATLLSITVFSAPQGVPPASFVDPLSLSAAEIAELPTSRRARERGEAFDPDGFPLSSYRAGELIVRARPGMAHLLDACHRSIGAQVVERMERAEFERVKLPPGLTVSSAVRLYRRQPFVLSAEHNFVRRLSHVPNDPEFNRGEFHQWNLKRINCQRAWDTTFGDEDVIIAIVDSGVDNGHNDLGASLVTGRNTLNDNSNTWANGSGTLDQAHGTIAALIAVANNNNVQGITGVAPGCRVMPIKAGDGGPTLDIWAASEGIEWAADHGAQVINMSFGAYTGAWVEEWAVGHAASAGCILVASAGNDDVSTKLYPAAYPNVIAVAGTDFKSDARDPDSNFGSWVDVAAPGMLLPVVMTNGTVIGAMGTSFAAPQVAAQAALLYPMFDHLGTLGARNAVVGRILNYCDPAPGGYVANGRINVYDSMNYGNYNNHSSFAPYYVDTAVYTLISGNAASLELGQGNNQRLVGESKAFDQTTQMPPSYTERFSMPMLTKVSFPGTLKGFEIMVEGHASTALNLDVHVYNFATSTWSLMGQMPMTTSDTTANFSWTASITPNYLNVVGEMSIRFSAVQSGTFTNPPPFQVRLDQVRVTTFSL